jgi:hypothetical protein
MAPEGDLYGFTQGESVSNGLQELATKKNGQT